MSRSTYSTRCSSQIARIGIEQRHLVGGGLDHPRMAVAHVRHIVDAIEIRAAAGIVEILPPAADDVQRLAIRDAERRPEMLRRPPHEPGGSRRRRAEDLVRANPRAARRASRAASTPARLLKSSGIRSAGRLGGLPRAVAHATSRGACAASVIERVDLGVAISGRTRDTRRPPPPRRRSGPAVEHGVGQRDRQVAHGRRVTMSPKSSTETTRAPAASTSTL